MEPPRTQGGSPEIAKRLFVDHDIFVKHCAGKAMSNGDRDLRIASRTKPDNDVFIAALGQLLDSNE